MGRKSKHREGSLQVWPRKRIGKFLPSVNWDSIKSDKEKIKGFIAYKTGMTSCIVKDLTANSLTKDKKIIVPATVLEIPPIRIFSVRFYKYGKVLSEVVVSNEKELKRLVRLSKKQAKNIDDVKDYDDVRVIVYSKPKETGIKKTPDIIEMGLSGKLEDKIKFAKDNIGKDIHFSDVFKDSKLLDIRGLTTGKGLESAVKRFGIGMKDHKSEKGRRRPGSLGPWHPAHVIFRVPMSGQMGMFTRIVYNLRVLSSGKISEKNINPQEGWNAYGKIKSDYLIVQGSVQGPVKRQVLLTVPLRPTKSQIKKNFEYIGLANESKVI